MFKRTIGIALAITVLLMAISFMYDFANQVSDWVFLIPVGAVIVVYGFGKLLTWILEKPIPSKLRKSEESREQ